VVEKLNISLPFASLIKSIFGDVKVGDVKVLFVNVSVEVSVTILLSKPIVTRVALTYCCCNTIITF
jgi:hypothetical protein